jgi:hypothetical protein
MAEGIFKINFALLQDLVFEANQQNKYISKKDIAKKYSKLTKYKTRLESPRALDILNLLETPEEKVAKVFEEILSSSDPVDLKYVKTAKVKAASDATPWRSKIAKEADLDIAYTNRILNKNPNYIKNKKLFNYLSASQLLKTELKDMPLGEQLKYADQAILGRPQYIGMTMSKAGKAGKGNRLLRDPAHKVMEFALRNFNQNKGQGSVKFFDNKGKIISYEPGIKIPYQKATFSYDGKKHSVKNLRKPGYMQEFFPEVYKNQIQINNLLNKEVDNPFKKGKIVFGDLMNRIQVKGYGWDPQTGSLAILHGPEGVKGKPFTNLNFNTQKLNSTLRDIEVGKFGKGLKQKLSTEAIGNLKGLQGDDLSEAIIKQQTQIAKNLSTGKPVLKGREEVALALKSSGVNLGPKESSQLDSLINNIKTLNKPDLRKVCRTLGTFDVGGGVAGCAEAIETIKTNPEKISKLQEITPTSAALGKVKNAATTFLNFAAKGKGFAIGAGLGVGGGALVKKFMNDDPSTYLTNDAQANAMILDTIDEKERQERMEAMGDAPELLDEARIAGEVGVTAAAIPGASAVYQARKKPFTRMVDGVKKTRPAMGTARAALGPVGKALSGFATPLGIAALTPLNVASSLYEGDSAYEVATDPLNYLAPALAGTMGSLSKEATRGMGATSKLAKTLRLGMSPGAIKMISRRFGLPGLALSSGISLFELADEYKSGRGIFGKKE